MSTEARLSALRAGRALPPEEDSWYSFLLEALSTSGPEHAKLSHRE
jgi:hypothetical protein